MVRIQLCVITYHTQAERHERCRNILDQCHSGKWPEDEVRAKSICKHEATRWKNIKLTKVLYMPQAVKNLLMVSRFVSNRATVGATQDKSYHQ